MTNNNRKVIEKKFCFSIFGAWSFSYCSVKTLEHLSKYSLVERSKLAAIIVGSLAGMFMRRIFKHYFAYIRTCRRKMRRSTRI